MVELKAGMKISRILACTTRLALRRVTPADAVRDKEAAPPTNAEALLKLEAEANDRCNEVAIADTLNSEMAKEEQDAQKKNNENTGDGVEITLKREMAMARVAMRLSDQFRSVAMRVRVK